MIIRLTHLANNKNSILIIFFFDILILKYPNINKIIVVLDKKFFLNYL